ncbi:MAG: ABC transporter ATP-binding protein [Propionibacteriaceae bacterium]|nr:ABC transporter ATP-binding protein [Propionibacteriaceae bacterium]
MNPLELRGVIKRYDGFTLGPIDLVVPRGYVMGFVGANGAGKTTTIKAALGLIHPDAGTAATLDHGRLGVVYDQPAYVPEWRASDVGRGLAPFYDHWEAARFDEMLAWAGIESGKRVKDLSRGMGMKLQLAVALSHGAELLILDEPTSGLDPLARTQLLEMIGEFMTDESHSVLFSTHITTDLEKIADHVTVIHDGRIVTSSTRDELLDGYRMVRGAASGLVPEVRPLVLGLREHGVGWEGLMATEDTLGLGNTAIAEAPTLEQIVVHVAKETHHV